MQLTLTGNSIAYVGKMIAEQWYDFLFYSFVLVLTCFPIQVDPKRIKPALDVYGVPESAAPTTKSKRGRFLYKFPEDIGFTLDGLILTLDAGDLYVFS